MNTFTSVSQIVTEFQLTSDPKDHDGLRKELKRIQADVHPDKTGGQFPSNASKEKFVRIGQAIEFVEAMQSQNTGLIHVSNLPAIIEAVTKSLQPVQERTTRQTLIRQGEASFRTSYSSSLKSSYSFPRISSATLAAMTGAIFAFANNLKDHPVLGWMVGLPFFNQLWTIVFLLSCSVLVSTWISERGRKRYYEFLLSEEGLSHVFDELTMGDRPFKGRFTRRMLLRILSERRRSRSPLYRHLYPTILPRDLASQVADIMLVKLQERGAIKHIPLSSMDEWYEVADKLERSESPF